jgi:hypothetical protein
MLRTAAAALLLALQLGADAAAPTGLLVDFKRSPSLGVRTKPAFTWCVLEHHPTGHRSLLAPCHS